MPSCKSAKAVNKCIFLTWRKQCQIHVKCGITKALFISHSVQAKREMSNSDRIWSFDEIRASLRPAVSFPVLKMRIVLVIRLLIQRHRDSIWQPTHRPYCL